MQLLVSVADADEAAAAMAGGADVIDAKDPSSGPLGPVEVDVLRGIAAAAVERFLTAALGDAGDELTVEQAAFDASAAGAHLVKIGFAGVDTTARAATLLSAAQRGALAGGLGRCGVVAVAYADGVRWSDPKSDPRSDPWSDPTMLLEVAAVVGVSGVLLDTARKQGPGLRELVSAQALAAWVARAHRLGLMVALAGRLQLDDLEFVRDAGADIAGVRGAACDGGRTGRISVAKVRELTARIGLAATSPDRARRRRPTECCG